MPCRLCCDAFLLCAAGINKEKLTHDMMLSHQAPRPGAKPDLVPVCVCVLPIRVLVPVCVCAPDLGPRARVLPPDSGRDGGLYGHKRIPRTLS